MIARWYGEGGALRPFYWVETQADYNALPLRPPPPAPEPPPQSLDYHAAVARSQIEPPLIWETTMPITWSQVVPAVGVGFSTTVLNGSDRAVGIALTNQLFFAAREFEKASAQPTATSESAEHTAWRSTVAELTTKFVAAESPLPAPLSDPEKPLAERITAARTRTGLTEAQRAVFVVLQLKLAAAPEPPFYASSYYNKIRSNDGVLARKTYAEWKTEFETALANMKAFLTL